MHSNFTNRKFDFIRTHWQLRKVEEGEQTLTVTLNLFSILIPRVF